MNSKYYEVSDPIKVKTATVLWTKIKERKRCAINVKEGGMRKAETDRVTVSHKSVSCETVICDRWGIWKQVNK